MLPKEVKNLKYTYWSHSTHSSDDEKKINEPFVDKKVTRKATLDELDTHTEKLNSFSKVTLFT
jgi:hypothetical protein